MFRRRSRPVRSDPISDFWLWWQTASTRVASIIDDGESPSLADEISGRVRAISRDLQWELGKGDQAKHSLCVSAAGNPDLRSTAKRWELGAPPQSDTWEYRSARVASPSILATRINFAGQDALLSETRFGINVDNERQLVDLVVCHPVFAVMPKDSVDQLMFLIVDWVLGEEEVERWIGLIESTSKRPTDALTVEALLETTDSLASRNAEPTWAVLQGAAPNGEPAIVLATRPMKPVDYPLLDLHGAITHRFAAQTAEGFPQQPAMEQLRRFEEALEAVSPEHSQLVAIVTTGGVRTFHLYCDRMSPARETVDRWLRSKRSVVVKWSMDPAWDAVRPYR